MLVDFDGFGPSSTASPSREEFRGSVPGFSPSCRAAAPGASASLLCAQQSMAGA